MHNGFAIALAWPETYCKQVGVWYDHLLKWVGINKTHYYKVGHAAVVLVNEKNGDCFYFDFGRYHAPYSYGRVRDAQTDHDLKIQTKSRIQQKQIINYTDLLKELSLNISCHGTGALHASYCPINFEAAYDEAKKLQSQSPISYGPFHLRSTNCSRFVKSVIVAGKPKLPYLFTLNCHKTITPTPIGVVKSLSNYQFIEKA